MSSKSLPEEPRGPEALYSTPDQIAMRRAPGYNGLVNERAVVAIERSLREGGAGAMLPSVRGMFGPKSPMVLHVKRRPLTLTAARGLSDVGGGAHAGGDSFASFEMNPYGAESFP